MALTKLETQLIESAWKKIATSHGIKASLPELIAGVIATSAPDFWANAPAKWGTERPLTSGGLPAGSSEWEAPDGHDTDAAGIGTSIRAGNGLDTSGYTNPAQTGYQRGGAGGAIYLLAGSGGYSDSATASGVTNTDAGAGGNAFLQAGDGGHVVDWGGPPLANSVPGAAGVVTVLAGGGGDAGISNGAVPPAVGGKFEARSGPGGSSANNSLPGAEGGLVLIKAGSGGANSAALAGGAGGRGGKVQLLAGLGGTSSNGTPGAGGDVELVPGDGATTDTSGQVVCSRGVSLATVELRPTAEESRRGQTWVVRGGAGVADIMYICIKNAADGYEWKVVALA